MFSQKFSRAIKSLCASILVLASSSLLATLAVNINQTNPVPPSCGEGGVPVLVGECVTYAITVTNNGPGSVRCITLDDSLNSSLNGPAGICLVSVSSCGAPCEQFIITPVSNGFNVTTTEKLGKNQSFVITATFRICIPANPDTLTNAVTVSALDCHDNPITATATQTTCVSGCALAATVFPALGISTQVCNDGAITFTANVTGACENPNSLTYSWATVPVLQFEQLNSNQLTLPGSILPPCGQGTVVATVTVTDTFTNCTTTASSGTVCSVPCADLSITKTGCRRGDIVTYTISITNNSATTPAESIVVTDCLPECLSVLTISEIPPVNGFSFTVNNNCITAALPTGSLFAPRGTASFEIVAQITGHCGKLICNTATVTSATFDPNQSNNSATVKIKTKKH